MAKLARLGFIKLKIGEVFEQWITRDVIFWFFYLEPQVFQGLMEPNIVNLISKQELIF